MKWSIASVRRPPVCLSHRSTAATTAAGAAYQLSVDLLQAVASCTRVDSMQRDESNTDMLVTVTSVAMSELTAHHRLVIAHVSSGVTS